MISAASPHESPAPLLRVADLFSGIGGFTRALHGMADTVLYCDNDPAAVKVLR